MKKFKKKLENIWKKWLIEENKELKKNNKELISEKKILNKWALNRLEKEMISS